MIDKVIVCGVKRGNKYIDANEINQCIGRAGRSYTLDGQAIIFSKSDQFNTVQQLLFGKLPPIYSTMDEVQNVGFNVLPMILKQVVYDEQSYNIWYKKTLAYIQGKWVSWEDVKQYLLQNNCICFFQNNVVVNQFGQISSRFYFNPKRIKILSDKLEQVIFNNDFEDELVLSWMFGFDNLSIGCVDEIQISNYKNKLLNKGYAFTNGQLLSGFVFYCLLTGKRPKWIKYYINNQYNDFDRLLNALKKICFLKKIEKNGFLDVIQIAVKKRVEFDVARVMKIFGLKTKKAGLQMISFEVYSEKDFQSKKDYILSYASRELKEELGI